MAQIDMKNALLKIRDGGNNTVISTGTITAIQSIGATVLAGTYTATPVIDGWATISGRRYKITAVTGLTSITIAAPGLLEATLAGEVVSITGPENSITVKVGDGTLTFSEKRNMTYTLDRGVLDEVKEGDEVPMEVKFDFVWDYIKGSSVALSPPSVSDALKKQGLASTWVSSDTDACKPYAVDLIVLYVPQCTGDQEEITLQDFRWESLDFDLKAGTVSCSGKCNKKTATVVRG